MSFGELLALWSVTAAIFGIFLTIFAIINGRSIRKLLVEESKGVREILSRIEQGQNDARKEMAEAIRYLANLIVSESEKTREAIREIKA